MEIYRLALLFSYLVLLKAFPPDPPDGWWCDPGLGFGSRPALSACIEAWEKMPESEISTWLTKHALPGSPAAVEETPLRFVDNENAPRCVITLDLDGESIIHQLLPVQPSLSKVLAAYLVSRCLASNQGGVRTYGLARTLRLMVDLPTDANGVRTLPGLFREDGNARYDVPLYMIITVSGPHVPDPADNDPELRYWLGRSLQDLFHNSRPGTMEHQQSAILLGGLMVSQASRMIDQSVRWWDFPVQPSIPTPRNVEYQCDPALGKPSFASCEGALFQFLQPGNLDVNPGQSLIISSGDCTISIASPYERITANWEAIRGVAERLVGQCVGSPVRKRAGGTAISQLVKKPREEPVALSEINLPPYLKVEVHENEALSEDFHSTLIPTASQPTTLQPSVLASYPKFSRYVVGDVPAPTKLPTSSPWLPPSVAAEFSNFQASESAAAAIDTGSRVIIPESANAAVLGDQAAENIAIHTSSHSPPPVFEPEQVEPAASKFNYTD